MRARRMARSERDRRIFVTHRRGEDGRRVLDRIEDRDVARAVFRRTEQRTVGVDRRIAAVAGDQVVQILLLVHPVAQRDDDVALHALRTLRLLRGVFALGDALGPIAEIFELAAAQETGGEADHLHARLARLDAAQPRIGMHAVLLGQELLGDRARRELAELMAAHAAIALDGVEINFLRDVRGEGSCPGRTLPSRGIFIIEYQ